MAIVVSSCQAPANWDDQIALFRDNEYARIAFPHWGEVDGRLSVQLCDGTVAGDVPAEEIMALADADYFPHLRLDEILIFKRWLHLHEQDWDSYDFDVRVGEGVTADGPQDRISEGFRQLTRKRIDVVARRRGEIAIIEIRPRADHAAIGNLLAYRTLFVRDFKPSEKISLLVVTDRVGADDITAIRAQGIEVEIV